MLTAANQKVSLIFVTTMVWPLRSLNQLAPAHPPIALPMNVDPSGETVSDANPEFGRASCTIEFGHLKCFQQSFHFGSLGVLVENEFCEFLMRRLETVSILGSPQVSHESTFHGKAAWAPFSTDQCRQADNGHQKLRAGRNHGSWRPDCRCRPMGKSLYCTGWYSEFSVVGTFHRYIPQMVTSFHSGLNFDLYVVTATRQFSS